MPIQTNRQDAEDAKKKRLYPQMGRIRRIKKELSFCISIILNILPICGYFWLGVLGVLEVPIGLNAFL